MAEKLTTSNYVTLIGGVGAAVVAAVLGFTLGAVYSAYQKADLRYEEQPFYRSGDEAVACLKLHNYGGSDAKDIIIAARFKKPLVKPPSTNDDTYPIQVTNGGKGEEAVSVSIKRLVPGQTLYVYFPIENPKGPLEGQSAGFVAGITLEGGQGKTGQPWTWGHVLSYALSVLGGMAIFLVFDLWKRLRAEQAARVAWQAHAEQMKTEWGEFIQALVKKIGEAKTELEQAKPAEQAPAAPPTADVSKPAEANKSAPPEGEGRSRKRGSKG